MADTHHRLEELHVEELQALGTAGRFARTMALSNAAIRAARQTIRGQHPTYTEEEVGLEFVAIYYGADLSRRVREYLANRRATR
jgi:hypothetical protein